MRTTLPTGHFPINRLDSLCRELAVRERTRTQSHVDVLFDHMMRNPFMELINDRLDEVFCLVLMHAEDECDEDDDEDDLPTGW